MTLLKTHRALLCMAVFLIFAVALGIYSYLEKDVVVQVDGKTFNISTCANTVGEALKEADIKVIPEDEISPGIDEKLVDGLNIRIKRAFDVKILSDGKEYTVKTTSDTVANLLAKAHILIGEKDKVKPQLDTYISAPVEVVVTRVSQKVVEEIKTIAYETVSRVDPDIPMGQKKVLQDGENGQEKIVTTLIIENGQIVSKNTTSTVIKQAKPRIILTGSMLVASRGGVDFAYTKKLRMLATAYTHTGNLTAMDTKPRVGVAAVDPDVIPLGSRLYIDGYGFARAEDTGGAIKGNKIDLFMESQSEADRYGRKWVTVYVLK
ncbi:MAG: ubiquitin-like domain-containing protein [Tepidanaerobacteraceae bacterium]|nr:ubiquitin-like domain-containing protein [Tepidanaerobacteraceae bacterium]